MAPIRHGCFKRRPPFSYSLFILALVEALLWVAPLLEAQNSDKNTFTFSLCDYLERENVNLKRVWRADEEQATERLADQAYEAEQQQSEFLQAYFKESQAETFSLKHIANSSCLEPRMPYGRSKRQAAVHDEQQQKDARAYSLGGNRKGKGKAETKSRDYTLAEHLGLFALACCFFLAVMPRCKGTRLLSLMSCLTLMSLNNGVQAASLDETNIISADAAAGFQQEPTMAQPEGDVQSGFFLLAPTKALFMIFVIVTLVVYLMLCFWLSVGWLHFAKRLVFGSTTKTHHREDSRDAEAEAASVPEIEDTTETETRFVSSMKPSMMVDFKFKTNVLHDALITYSTVLNLSTLRSLLFDREQDEEAPDDLE